MEQWSPVKVIWFDAHGGDTGWGAPEELEHRAYEVTTIGLIYKYDYEGITVVMSHSDDQIGGYTFVPKVNIISVTQLVEEEA
jgi:hypothetical protein